MSRRPPISSSLARLTLASMLGVGCGSGPASWSPSDAGSGRDATLRDALTDGTSDASACLSPGTGEIRVMLQRGPGVLTDPSDVWLAAMCVLPGGERSVRVIRVDPRNGPATLDGLGPGEYVIRASTGGQPGIASTLLNLAPGGVTVTTLTFTAGPAPIAVLRIDPADPLPDAGTTGIDAARTWDATPAEDAVAVSPRRHETPIVAGTAETPEGTFVVELDPRAPDRFAARVSVIHRPCPPACRTLRIDAAEFRLSRGGAPFAYAVLAFATASEPFGLALEPNRTALAPAVDLPGNLDVGDLSLSASLFGAGGTGDASVPLFPDVEAPR